MRSISLGLALGACAVAGSAEAQGRRVTATPYIELGQVLDADLNSGDVLTYSTIAAGIDLAANTSRVNGQLSYRYERRIAWDDRIGDSDVHTGLARVSAKVEIGRAHV